MKMQYDEHLFTSLFVFDLKQKNRVISINHRVATGIKKLNSRTLLGYFPGLFKQWRSYGILRPGARNILAPPVNKTI